MVERNALKILKEISQNDTELQCEYLKEKNRYTIELAKKAWRKIIAAIEKIEEEYGIECDTPDFIEVLGEKIYTSMLDD